MNVVETFRAFPASQHAEYMRENKLGPFAPDAEAQGYTTGAQWRAAFGPRRMVAGDIGVDK